MTITAKLVNIALLTNYGMMELSIHNDHVPLEQDRPTYLKGSRLGIYRIWGFLIF